MMQFWLKHPLCDTAGDGSDAGGGAGAGNSGLTKDDVTAMMNTMFNGLDKRFNKKFTDIETSLKGLDGIVKVFGDVKPKKLAKLLARAGKKGKGEDDDDAAGANAGGSNGGNGNDNNRGESNNRQIKVLDDPFKKKKFKELTEQVAKLVTERDEANKKAIAAQIDSKVDNILGEFQWANAKARGSAFKELRPLVESDDDGDLVIGGAKFDSYIRAKVPEEFDYLLAPKAKGGSGAVRSGGKKTEFDIDSLGANSTKEELAEAARHIAAAYGSG